MKPGKILLFFLSVFAVLFVLWYFFPAEGVEVGGLTLRFPCYESRLGDLREGGEAVDVDSVLVAMHEDEARLERMKDSLDTFREYLRSNVGSIVLPGDDPSFLDSLFAALESPSDSGRVVRIMHYGDSQLEMDRISGTLRQKLQERFGGSGPGMVPMIQHIASVSVRQGAGGSIGRYSCVADTLASYDSRHHYGIMTQFVKVRGGGTFTFRKSDHALAKERAKEISRVSVLFGSSSPAFTLTLRCDTLERTEVLDSAVSGTSLVTWTLPGNVERGTLTFKGSAEVYGIMLDGPGGITVDNQAIRGCAGDIFTRIDSTLMAENMRLAGTGLVILQYGGNAMPGIGSTQAITKYVDRMQAQMDYFKKVAPWARILFVGPADMCKSVNGRLVTWPRLEQLNDSLRTRCLRNGVAYWDTFRVMGGAGSMRGWVSHNPPLGGPDYIHFTSRGADEIGESLAKAITSLYDYYCLRRQVSVDGQVSGTGQVSVDGQVSPDGPASGDGQIEEEVPDA